MKQLMIFTLLSIFTFTSALALEVSRTGLMTTRTSLTKTTSEPLVATPTTAGFSLGFNASGTWAPVGVTTNTCCPREANWNCYNCVGGAGDGGNMCCDNRKHDVRAIE